jgi:hypothetical protein
MPLWGPISRHPAAKAYNDTQTGDGANLAGGMIVGPPHFNATTALHGAWRVGTAANARAHSRS